MKYNPDIHHRRSIRLKDYDYSQGGRYFITICTQGRENFFGEIQQGKMVLSPAGKMVRTAWDGLPERFPEIELDEFMVMPNHVHGTIVIVGAPLVGALGGGAAENGDDARKAAGSVKNRTGTRPAPTKNIDNQNTATAKPSPTLGGVVGIFKSITTLEYVRGIKDNDWPPFPEKLWQRNYYEHIIRSEKELNKIREYIACNPERWEFDRENPGGQVDTAEKDFWAEQRRAGTRPAPTKNKSNTKT